MCAKEQTALVLGLGVSGRAAARMLASEDVKVTSVDKASGDSLASAVSPLTALGIEVLLGVEELPKRHFDLCVVSPGIAMDSLWVKSVLDQGTEVVSELEVGYRRCNSKIIAVTGSNGKSTMVKFCRDLLTAAGKRVSVGGNYGTPLCEILLNGFSGDWLILEVSSFQLEGAVRFQPDIGVLLNVQPDHLDRHGDMKTYARLKAKLFDRMLGNQTGIVLDTDKDNIAAMSEGSCKWVTFGCSEDADYRYVNGTIKTKNRTNNVSSEYCVRRTYFENDIMGRTAAAAAAVADNCGINQDCFAGVAMKFEGLPHRMQKVGEKDGVVFIDDSKATNLSAMRAALLMMNRPVHLIAGGLPKKENLNSVKEILAKKVKTAYLIGKAANEMNQSWGNIIACEKCGTLARAVAEAWTRSGSGEIILLSPGCASFDQFVSFAERGDEFVKLIRKLEGRKT